MKNYLLLILLFVSFQCLTAQERLVIDKVIAKVGTETILLSDVEGQYAYASEQSADTSPELKCEIIQSLVGQKLIVHQAKLDSIIVSEDEIEASLNFRIDGVLRQMNGDESFFQEYYGMTVHEMRENLRDDLEQQMLAERMQNKIISEVQITPKEVKQFYSTIPKDSIPFLNAEVEISEIVVSPQVNKEERLKALEQIIKIRKQLIEEGKDFAEMANLHSDDPGSARGGGDLGFAERGTFVPEFEAEAYSLDTNQISEPIETEFGFHLIQLLERRGNKIHLRHILVKPDITDEDKLKAKTKLDTIKMKIDEGEIKFSQAVKKYSIDDIPSYHNNGIIQNPTSGKSSFETSELPTEIYFAIEEMDPGQVSEPLEYPLPSGEIYYRIIQLQSKTKPHKASLELDYTKIQNYAKESKKSEYFAKWLEDKLNETYIEVDQNYVSCPELDKILNLKQHP